MFASYALYEVASYAYKLYNASMTKRTYNPSKLKQKRRHGYRSRSTTKEGKKILKKRMLKGRSRLSH